MLKKLYIFTLITMHLCIPQTAKANSSSWNFFTSWPTIQNQKIVSTGIAALLLGSALWLYSQSAQTEKENTIPVKGEDALDNIEAFKHQIITFVTERIRKTAEGEQNREVLTLQYEGLTFELSAWVNKTDKTRLPGTMYGYGVWLTPLITKYTTETSGETFDRFKAINIKLTQSDKPFALADEITDVPKKEVDKQINAAAEQFVQNIQEIISLE